MRRNAEMPERISDTHPDIAKLQISMLRNASVAKRISIMRSLSETTMKLSRRAIKRANPDLDETELQLKWVSHHYGEKLADSLREYLKKRQT